MSSGFLPPGGSCAMFSQNDRLYQVPEQNILKQAKGNFARRVFIALLSEPDLRGNSVFLEKVLNAAGLDPDKDTSRVEVPPTDTFSFLPVIKEKHAEYILVFGLPPKQIGLHAEIPPYQPSTFYGVTFLFADKLSTLESDKTLKGNLWQALRQLFL